MYGTGPELALLLGAKGLVLSSTVEVAHHLLCSND